MLVDVNLLLYAVDSASPHHERARIWLEERLSGTEPLFFSWTVLLAFVRISTRASVFESPLTPGQAFDLVESWLRQPCSAILTPTDRHVRLLRVLLQPLGTAGNLTSDAHLAALALEYDTELGSADADFSRFPDLRWTNPLLPRRGRGRARPSA